MRYYAWQNSVNADSTGQLVAEMTKLMDKAIQATEKQREDMLELPTSSIDFSRSLRNCQRYDTLEPWRANQVYFRTMDYLELKKQIAGSK
jgi:hypothetical protein